MSIAIKWTAARALEQAARIDVPPSASPLAAEVVRSSEVAVLWAELTALRATVQRLEGALDDLGGGGSDVLAPGDLGPPLSLDDEGYEIEGGCSLDAALDNEYPATPNLEDAVIEALGRGPLGFLGLAGELYADFERDYPDEEVFYDYLESTLYGMGDSYFFDGFQGRGGTVKIMLEDVPADVKGLGDQRRERQCVGKSPVTGKPVYQTVPLDKNEMIWREKLKARLRADARRAGKKIPRSWERNAPAAIGAGI
ncbi:hypothetical protein IIA79_02495 [bacterium]|nr:hypothetical protein [bacterium]